MVNARRRRFPQGPAESVRTTYTLQSAKRGGWKRFVMSSLLFQPSQHLRQNPPYLPALLDKRVPGPWHSEACEWLFTFTWASEASHGESARRMLVSIGENAGSELISAENSPGADQRLRIPRYRSAYQVSLKQLVQVNDRFHGWVEMMNNF